MAGTPLVGLIANPVSARDIRRVVTNAGSLQAADRAGIVLRALAALGACGVPRVLAMPDRKGLRTLVERGMQRERRAGHALPDVEYLDLAVTDTVTDTIAAAAAMADASVAVIVVLGGDGTHRAVVGAAAKVPVAGISTGTNNAYPEMREPTITGLAAGLYATGAIGDDQALRHDKLLEVAVNDDEHSDIALVDVVVSDEPVVGARALWHADTLRHLFVSFADPEAIGMSAIAGLIEPIGRTEPAGLHVRLDPDAQHRVLSPIGPGLVTSVGVIGWSRLAPDVAVEVMPGGGVVALDGEREIAVGRHDRITVTLRPDAFRTVDVARCMHLAARRGLLHNQPTTPEREQL